MLVYQHRVKEAGNKYFPNLIAKQHHNHRTLFKTINKKRCEEFLIHFTNKTVTMRQHFDKVDKETVTDVGSYLRPTLNHLSEISLSTLEHVVVQIRSTTCPSNCIPTWFLKEVFQSVGPDILTIINCSLSAGIFPSFSDMPLYILF